MRHRHLKTNEWTLAAIDSALERGNLEDWRELFAKAKKDKKIAESILKVAAKSDQDGASKLARKLVIGIYPELSNIIYEQSNKRKQSHHDGDGFIANNKQN